MTNHPTPPQDSAVYTGSDVIDQHGNHVGRVTDVLYDEAVTLTGPTVAEPSSESPDDDVPRPTWLVVNPGPLRAAHYMPVAGSYRTSEGAIVSPWDKDWIKAATKVSGDHVLTKEQREELIAHYALSS